MEGEGGHDGHAGLDHGLQRRFVHVGGVQDEVEAGFGGVPDAVRAPAVAHHRDVQGVGHVHHQLQLVAPPGLGFAEALLPRGQAGDMHLDPIHAALDLAAHLGGDLVCGAHHLAVADEALVRDQAPGGASGGGEQGVAAGGHARPRHDAGLDGVPQVHADLEQAVRVQKAGHPGAQQLAHVDRGDDGGQPFAAMVEQFVVGAGFVKADVAVGVYEAGHERQPGGVDALGWPGRLRRRIPQAENALPFDDNRGFPGRIAQPVNEGAVFDDPPVRGRRHGLNPPARRTPAGRCPVRGSTGRSRS